MPHMAPKLDPGVAMCIDATLLDQIEQAQRVMVQDIAKTYNTTPKTVRQRMRVLRERRGGVVVALRPVGRPRGIHPGMDEVRYLPLVS